MGDKRVGEISRRELLGGTGRLAVVAGVGTQLIRATPATPLSPRTDPPRPAPPRTAQPATSTSCRHKPDWAALARHLHGRLLRPGDPGYVVASVPYNKRYADIRPGGVALCANATDVRTALRWARDNGVPFAARSGGHSYGGYSASHGLIISLARMNTVDVDPAALTITLGAGARNRDLYAHLAGTGVAAPSGRCPSVAVSGLLLGGGFGFSSRHLGLTCDHLLETEVVTAAGDVLRVTPRSHPDLFWACQGGGGGNFGINTGYRLRAVPVGDVAVYEITWPWPDARPALTSMLELMTSAPDTLSCRVGLGVTGGGPATGGTPHRTVSALGLYFGPRDELADLLAPVLAAARPSKRLIEDRGYVAAQAMLAGNVPFDRFSSKSRFLDRSLPADGIDTAIRWIERWPGSTNPGGAGLTLFAWGGAINRVDPAATAFVHRTAAFLTDNETTWTARDSPRVVDANLDWLAGMSEALAQFGIEQAYQNFIDPGLKGWETAYYGANLGRLMEVKRRYDPDDVFRFAQAIPEPPPRAAS
jgi:FAD/FMN-containing dehydrogenase